MTKRNNRETLTSRGRIQRTSSPCTPPRMSTDSTHDNDWRHLRFRTFLKCTVDDLWGEGYCASRIHLGMGPPGMKGDVLHISRVELADD